MPRSRLHVEVGRWRAARIRTWTRVAACLALTVWASDRASAQQGWTGDLAAISGIVSAVPDHRLAVDADGGVTAVWVEEVPVYFAVKAARKPPGGVWSAPVALSNPLTGADIDVAAQAPGAAMAIWTSDAGVSVSRMSALTDGWTPALLIAARPAAHRPRLVLDAAGDGIAVWYLDGSNRIETARYDAAADQWSAVTDLGTGWFPDAHVDGAGNAVALWVNPSMAAQALQAARYTKAAGAWSAPTTLATAWTVASPRLAVDYSGNALAAWAEQTPVPAIQVRVAVSVAPGDSWSAPIALASLPFSFVVPQPAVAIATGAAVVAWTTADQGPMVSRAQWPASGSWTGAAPLAGPTTAVEIDLAADGLAGVFAVWRTANGRVWASRSFDDAHQWTAPAQLSLDGIASVLPDVEAAPLGAGLVTWVARAGGVQAVQTAQWLATPSAPTVTGATAGPRSLVVTVMPPTTTAPPFVPRYYDCSLDDGRTWSVRVRAAETSLVITGLIDYKPYRLRLRAVNVAGFGQMGPPVSAVAGVGADAPVALVAADVSGSTVTFTWVPPQVGLVPDGYLLEGGVAPGQVLAALPTPDAVPRLTVTAPPGVYFVRVRAIAVGRAGNASNEVRVAIGIPTPPSSPAGLLGLANGADLALSWTNTFDGGVPTRLQLIVVDGPVTGIVPLPLTESFRFSGVPDGTYTFRVVAANASGASPPSAPVTLTFPGACIGPPGAVTHVTLQRQGTVVTVSWLPPPLGPAVETYIVFVSGAATGSLSTAARSVSGVVGRGTHTVHVAAANACGTGPRSTPHTVVVP